MSDEVQEQTQQDAEQTMEALEVAAKMKAQLDELEARFERLNATFTPDELRAIHDVFYAGRWTGEQWDQVVTPILAKCRAGMGE